MFLAVPTLTAALVLVAVSVSAFGSMVRPGLFAELLLVSYLSLAVAVFQRSRRVAAALSVLAVLAVYAASIGKWLVFNEQLFLTDLVLVDELLTVVSPAWSVGAAALLAGAGWTFIRNVRIPGTRHVLIVAPVACVAVLMFSAPGAVIAAFDAVRPDVYWRPVDRMWRNGPIFSLIRQLPDLVRRRRALTGLPPAGGTPGTIRRDALPAHAADAPDVHVVLMESFVDPLNFPGIALPLDPMDARFRRWMNDGPSMALSPTFGGQTARAEFEVLCGLPSYAALGVEFNLLERPVPCLPRLLRERGYLTIGSVPVAPSFFRVGHAYPALGFERRHFYDDFDSSDLDGDWVPDAVTLGATLARVAPLIAGDRPVFSYVVTTAGHEPFTLDPVRRPPIIDGDGWMIAMANAVHYSSAAVADYVEAVEARNHNALLVVVGDHLPIFGTANQGFDRAPYRPRPSGARVPWRVDSLDARATPLVIRKARRTVSAGLVPHYAIPELILSLLSEGAYCRSGTCVHDRPTVYRPQGEVMVVTADDVFPGRVCEQEEDSSAGCASARDLHGRLRSAYDEVLRAGIRP